MIENSNTKSLLKFISNSHTVHELACIENGHPIKVWEDFKQCYEEFTKLKKSIDNKLVNPNLDNFYNRMQSFDNYISQWDEEKPLWTDYVIEINFYADSIVFSGYSLKTGEFVYSNRLVLNSSSKEGNCIDDFVRRGIEPLLENINDLLDSIKSRLETRKTSIEYHQTGCYEMDFAQIGLIRIFANKISENCNKHLERISEHYTKL